MPYQQHSIFVFTVQYFTLYCICIFCRTERLPRHGGRERVLTAEQETIVNMVLENNAITIKQIQSIVLAYFLLFVLCKSSSCVCCDVQATALLEKKYILYKMIFYNRCKCTVTLNMKRHNPPYWCFPIHSSFFPFSTSVFNRC